MKNIEITNSFTNVRDYLLLLALDEQIKKIDEIIKYCSDTKLTCLNVKHKYAKIEQFKEFKRYLIRKHKQKLRDNPSIIENTPALYMILNK